MHNFFWYDLILIFASLYDCFLSDFDMNFIFFRYDFIHIFANLYGCLSSDFDMNLIFLNMILLVF